MKKVTIILAILFVSTFVFGQEKGTHDFGINVGFFSTNDFLNTTEDIIQSGTFENTVISPTIAINYKYEYPYIYPIIIIFEIKIEVCH